MTEPILTLEPLIDAVVEGVRSAGWELSGLQKTSSTEFEGEWAGHTTRSAYLFFHADAHETASVEGYLDETDRGLRATLSLVVDLRPVWEHASVPDALDRVAELSSRHLPDGYTTPVVVRLTLSDTAEPSTEAQVESRVKLRVPRAAIAAGGGSVAALSAATVRAFEALLDDPSAGDVLDGLGRPD